MQRMPRNRASWLALAGFVGVAALIAVAIVAVARRGEEPVRETSRPRLAAPRPAPPQTYTVPRVMRAFRRQTGVPLVVFREGSTPEVTSLRTRPHPTQRFGDFQLFVFRPTVARRMSRVFTNGARPDADGVHWVSDRTGGWIAVTLFARNLALGWFPPSHGSRSVDPTWRRLQDVVRRLR
jgi:hypothetical protein